MNKYNPKIHHRRSIRLEGYNYSQAGLYIITICCQNRICRFGHVKNGEMILNEYGHIAYKEWAKLEERFSNFELDVFQIMPNHLHGIIKLVEATLGVAQNDLDIKAGASPALTASTAPSVSDIVGAYKSLVANGCLDIYKLKNKTIGKL